MGAAKGVAAGQSEREASHIGFFDLVFEGRTDAAIAAVYTHLTAWPRDALIVTSAANPNGVIGGSGRIGQKASDRGADGQASVSACQLQGDASPWSEFSALAHPSIWTKKIF